jgi:hypothetical protein
MWGFDIEIYNIVSEIGIRCDRLRCWSNYEHGWGELFCSFAAYMEIK